MTSEDPPGAPTPAPRSPGSFSDVVVGPPPDEVAVSGGPGWRTGRIALGPVWVLLAIIGVVVAGGILLAVLGSSHTRTPSAGSKADGLGVEPASDLLRPIEGGDEPPGDVLKALVVPTGSVRRATEDYDGGEATYDRSATFTNTAAPRSIVSFYERELTRTGWSKVEAVAPASGTGTELLATIESDDGYYWQVGITVRQASGSLSAALAGGSPTPTSSFVIRLEEVDDES